MVRISLSWLVALVLLPDFALAQQGACDANSAWRRVRQSYPVHSQTLAKCANAQTGEQVIVLTEPPPHLVRTKAEAIVKALFSTPVASVQRKRHQLGFDGWAEDLVIVVRPRTADDIKTLNDDLTLLSIYAFGSAYKAEVENIARLGPPKFWEAPPALDVSADELFTWLLGPKAEMLVTLEGGEAATLSDRADRRETGIFQTVATGLIVALLPTATAGDLNDHVDDLRRFAVDTDAFLGALKVDPGRVALVGRERTTPFATVPPLRVETLLLLASHRSAQLSQSYERNRAFAGKLYSKAGDLFGWDWAPIMLSDVLNDTEFGSLLNFTDNMLKGWSESGRIEYKGFQHEKPRLFPFGAVGAFKTMAAKTLTYNWNTAGVGFVSTKDNIDIFVVRNTGSLPVSYFPEGSQSNAGTKAKLVQAEDTAYKYFSSLRNPLLGRVVQYAALYQVFQTFDMQAKPPQDEAPAAASIVTVEDVLTEEIETALNALANPSSPSTADFLLSVAYLKFGAKGQEFETRNIPEINAEVRKLRNKAAAEIAALDQDMTPDWRKDFAQERATGLPMMSIDLKNRVDQLGNDELSLVRLPEQVRKAVLAASQRDPDGWIRTPSIVVSRGEVRELVGGHNIGGLPTRVEIDSSIAKGTVEAIGSYADGRVLRVNPADAPAARDLVRIFDREVGLRDANVLNGIAALEARLAQAPVAPQPVRNMAVALNYNGLPPRAVRGAQPSSTATPVGYGPGSITPQARAQMQAIGEHAEADLVVSRSNEGYAILHVPSKRSTVATNYSSFLSALDQNVVIAAAHSPSHKSAKIVFQGMSASELKLMKRNLAAHEKAAGGAGGKPPFGGGRLAAFDDAREPGKPLRQLAIAERRNSPTVPGETLGIHAEGTNVAALKAKPQWDTAEINFRDPGSVLFANAPDFGTANLHFVEVRVSVAAEGGRLKRLLVNAIGVFRSLTKESVDAINPAVTKLFKTTEPIDIGEALTRYKTLMMKEFKADDVWINLRQEGADLIVTEAPAGVEVIGIVAPGEAAPRG
jgi:hypothetical protein